MNLNIFSKPTPKESLRKQQRDLKSIQRDLDRDLTSLQREEKKLQLDIKKAAQSGQISMAKTLAKQLVMLRKQQEKNLKTKASVQGIGYRATAMHSNTQMATAMKGATRAMVATSKGMDLGKMQNTMMEFEKESLAMEMKEEMMNDTLEGLEDTDDEEEGEDIMNAVLDELGLEIGGQMSNVPSSSLPTTAQKDRVKKQVSEEDLELEERLNSLRNL